MRHARFRVVTKEERSRNEKDVMRILKLVTVATIPLQSKCYNTQVLFIFFSLCFAGSTSSSSCYYHQLGFWGTTVASGHRLGCTGPKRTGPTPSSYPTLPLPLTATPVAEKWPKQPSFCQNFPPFVLSPPTAKLDEYDIYF